MKERGTDVEKRNALGSSEVDLQRLISRVHLGICSVLRLLRVANGRGGGERGGERGERKREGESEGEERGGR